jgi:hypothetical protein
MNKYIPLLSFTMGLGLVSSAQTPEDALRSSWNTSAGTARTQAIGGAINALGGDITSLYVNPAGLGFFKTGELVLSPGLSFHKSKSNYLGNAAKTPGAEYRFVLGTSGVVWGWSNPRDRATSKAFSIGVNRTANFGGYVYYRGENSNSSASEQPTNEFFQFYQQQKALNPNLSDAVIVDRALNADDVSLSTKMGLYTYLIDIDSSGGNKRIVSRAEEVGRVMQENEIITRGGVTEIALGYAVNKNDKVFFGFSLGIPIVNYERDQIYSETDATGIANNKFNYSRYTENYRSQGAGLNAKLGMIFKPKEYIRIGLGVHSPTFYGLSDEFSANLETDVENVFSPGQNVGSVDARTFFSGADPNFTYDLMTPAKFILGGAYVFREVRDVTKQKGFLSADIEYVNYTWNRFATVDPTDDPNYFTDLNSTVDDIYRGAFNFRLGGELKFNTIMTRLGFAYYGNPYENPDLSARRMLLSGGLGYRNKGIFVDLTYVHQLIRDINFPYLLEAPRVSNFAQLNQTTGQATLTFGVKF